MFLKVNYFPQYRESCKGAQSTCESTYNIFYNHFNSHEFYHTQGLNTVKSLLCFELTIMAYKIIFLRMWNGTYFKLVFWIKWYWITGVLLYTCLNTVFLSIHCNYTLCLLSAQLKFVWQTIHRIILTLNINHCMKCVCYNASAFCSGSDTTLINILNNTFTH